MLVVVTDVADEVDVAAVVTNEFIKAMILWMIIGRVHGIALMPLYNQSGRVSRLIEHFGKRRLTWLQALAMLWVSRVWMNDGFDACTLLISSRYSRR